MTPRIERHSLTRAAVRRFRPRLMTAHVFSVPSATSSAELARLTSALVKRCTLHGDAWNVATVVTPAGGLKVVVIDPEATPPAREAMQ